MDIYMAGSTFKGLDEWLQSKGYNKLLSQVNDRKIIREWVNAKRTNPNTQRSKLFIDSGAFSAHTKGIEVDVDDYIEYLNLNDDALTVFAQVDKIPGTFGIPYTYQELQEAPMLSWENYLYMAPKLKSRYKLIPIFHQQEDFKWLRNLLEYVDENGNHIPYIGISTRNDAPVKDKKAWLSMVFDIIARSSNPNVKTHAFGMTSISLLEQFPFTSADSTSWIMTAVNGSIFTEYGVLLISEVSKGRQNHFDKLDSKSKENLTKYIESRGFTVEGLSKDYKLREMFNITYMNDWASNYVYKGGDKKKNSLFNLVGGSK